MSISSKLLQVNQVKQDIKTAIETKGIPMTNVAFTEYADKILEISSGGVELSYLAYCAEFYDSVGKIDLFSGAWQHSLEVDISEIERKSTYSTQYGKLQYPNGESFGVIIPDGTTKIGTYAFDYWTSNNQPLVIPNSVTSIGERAFHKWTSNNQPLVIPDSVTSISVNAFYEWTSNDQPLVLPNSVTSIGENAFAYWSANNQPLVIPEGVTSIGKNAFRDWTSNNQPLVIPQGVTSIGDGAFEYWLLVPYVEMKAVIPPSLASANAFSGQNNAPIYVPDESLDDYKTATNWVSLASRIFSINDK